MASRVQARLGARDHRPVGGQDHREHGDRPQRHARPVGLDERPLHPLLDLGLGHRLARLGVEALPQLRPPHVHERRRQGPRRRLRDHARRPEPEVVPVLPRPAVLQHPADGVLRVGRRGPRPRLRRDQDRQEAEVADPRRAQVDRPQGPPADRQGLHRLPGAERPQGLQVDAGGELHGQHRPQRLVERDHLLRALPRSGVRVHRGGGRRRPARAPGTCAS